MTLVDSSIWIDHFRQGNASLAELLETDQALCHPFIVGELVCGNLCSRTTTIELLQTLPAAPVAEHHEVLVLIEWHRLMASGIGWFDAHLLASALLAGAVIWTQDRPLAKAARRLGVCSPYTR
jgi:predicted nucleic acid-binding protein